MFPFIPPMRPNGYIIENAALFDGGHLSKTLGTPTSSTTSTYSCWVNLNDLTADLSLIDGTNVAFTTWGAIFFKPTTGQIQVYTQPSGAVDYGFITSAYHRGLTGWLHVVLVQDTSNATATDRFQLYINNVRLTSFSTDYGTPTLSYSTYINSAIAHTIGKYQGNSAVAKYYLAEVYLIDGQALTPSDFGETNPDGFWIPKKYTGTYGTNGFYLDFADAANLGVDVQAGGTSSEAEEVFLTHFDGSDAATSATDVSWNGATITFVANAQLDTAQQKFGTASLLLDGTGDYVSFPDNDLYYIGTKDFTVDAWVRFNTTAAGAIMAQWTGTGSQRSWEFVVTSSAVTFYTSTNGSAWNLRVTESWSPSTDTWYHVAAERTGGSIYVYVDGTMLGSGTANTEDFFNATIAPSIGAVNSGGANNFDGWIDEPRLVIGTGRYGGSGFTPETTAYSDHATGNHWTVNGTITQVSRTPTDSVAKGTANYATGNPLDKDAGVSLSNGNRTFSSSTNADDLRCSFSVTEGKWSFEFEASSLAGLMQVGWADTTVTLENSYANGINYRTSGHSYTDGTADAGYGATWGISTRMRCEFDADTGTMEFFKANVSQGTKSITMGGRRFTPFVRFGTGTNTGRFYFAEDEWTDTPTAGFKSLSSANVTRNQTGVLADVFVTTLDTEANIVASVAAAHSFSTSVTAYKNRDAVETWAWRFSHDASNEHAVSTTDTYQAVRTLAGSNNWVAYTINGDNTKNIDIGAQAHTNGAGDTVVTHNLGATNAVMLFPRANGDVYYYHPHLTAGKLVKVNGSAAEAASTRIKSVTTNAFTIESAAPTDTYDYIVLGESDFLKLWTNIGNGNADGPFVNLNGSPKCTMERGTNIANIFVYDTTRSPNNVVDTRLQLSQDNAESSVGDRLRDLLSNGFKHRSTDVDVNGSGQVKIGVAFVEPEPLGAAQLRAK